LDHTGLAEEDIDVEEKAILACTPGKELEETNSAQEEEA
jgi:hypothetical protein